VEIQHTVLEKLVLADCSVSAEGLAVLVKARWPLLTGMTRKAECANLICDIPWNALITSADLTTARGQLACPCKSCFA